MVVANRAEEFKPDGTQVAWLIQPENEPEKHVGMEDIARNGGQPDSTQTSSW